MTISAKIIADSISTQNIRLTTMQLKYPKFIHGEFMTHRVFSRNASSSRAIPVKRLIQDVIDDPAMPVFWGKNQRGMQAIEELAGADRTVAIDHWLYARDRAVGAARLLAKIEVHKQIVNRIIEPWAHINVVVTATEWANFYALRRHSAAQPEIHALADAMWEAQEASVPTLLKHGQWHLPYVDALIGDDGEQYYRYHFNQYGTEFIKLEDARKMSVASCARTSYKTHDNRDPILEEDLGLCDSLLGSVPLHASPAEHQATPDIDISDIPGTIGRWMLPRQHANFVGWRQYRKMLPNENVIDR
jgi:thymidylate synthase ThyX